MGFCCFIIPIPFVVALLAVFATSLLLPSGAPILAVAAQSPFTCSPDKPQVNCLIDPCKITSDNQCPLGCRADYCGGCNAHCLCRHRLDCLSSGGGECKKDGSVLGTCVNLAPAKLPGEVEYPKIVYINEPATPASPSTTDAAAEPAADEAAAAPQGPSVILTDKQESDAVPTQTCRMYCGPNKVCLHGKCVRPNPRFPVQHGDRCALMRCGFGTRCIDGRCEAPSCTSNTDCSSDLYCNAEKKCVPQGNCAVPADCATDPSFVHPMCVGAFTCSAEHRCGYTCSN